MFLAVREGAGDVGRSIISRYVITDVIFVGAEAMLKAPNNSFYAYSP
jgi:hypothetical protein